jgi:hypothetical protein
MQIDERDNLNERRTRKEEHDERLADLLRRTALDRDGSLRCDRPEHQNPTLRIA